MLDLTTIFRPATAHPNTNTLYYSEISPCAALKPYVRCFWGTALPVSLAKPVSDVNSLVIPDCCMDIIFRTDLANDSVTAFFCGLDENGWTGGTQADPGELTSTFSVRFYLWAAHCFTPESLSESAGRAVEAAAMFPDFVREMGEFLRRGLPIEQNVRFAEGLLLREMFTLPDENLMNITHRVISSQGRLSCKDLSEHTGCTEKRLQRLFRAKIGVSPKSVMSLIRYQLLWQQLLKSPELEILDAVEMFGYYDQPHLLHDFKRRHLMTPREALALARGK